VSLHLTDVEIASLVEGHCRTPFDFLGNHPVDPEAGLGRAVRVFIAWASGVTLLRQDGRRRPLERLHEEGLFQAHFPDEPDFFPYRLAVTDLHDRTWEVDDPYRFPPALDEGRVWRFLEGTENRVHDVLGARPLTLEGVQGVVFAVWAPHAAAVNLMGTMNQWDARCHPMRPRGGTGVWELFVPGIGAGTAYKYQIVTASGRRVDKADPCGRAVELRPATASLVWDLADYAWEDGEWMTKRASFDPASRPMSTYEVHLGSWKRAGSSGHEWLSYRALADDLLPYVKGLGFTHIELMPVLEHPYDQSWGYQPLGFFAPTSRYGTPDDFRHFVDRAHQLQVGVILDWVPGHFPEDLHGLVRFDGTALYEYPDPRRGRHPDWGTWIFDYGKAPVRSFLLSSAMHWLEDYHIDGLRVDAVASILYLDYSREHGEWLPNEHGGNENLDAVEFLKSANDVVRAACPGALVIAEESTAWAGVSQGTDRGGLGFDQKWNMGWMNDTLKFMEADPVHRRWEYRRLTFSMLYAFSERYVLPLSHDEVVHGKRSLLSKMPGSREAKLANLRALYAYMWSHPGKKLLFMGGELGQWAEWNVDGSLDWALLRDHDHAGIQRLVTTLNALYASEPALHDLDFHPDGFEWLDCHDEERTTVSYLRWSREWKDFVAVVVNLTPVPRDGFWLPVPFAGRYRVVLNTDAWEFGGAGARVPQELDTVPGEVHGRDQHLDLLLPGLSALYLKRITSSVR
jgi:1,4-alpha-glucan branching enzyme